MSSRRSQGFGLSGASQRLLLGLFVLSCSACQMLFGDFSTDPGEGGTPGSLGGSTAVACVEGKSQCVEAVLQTCINGVWSDPETCLSASHCNGAEGRCELCTEDELSCAGNVLRRCSANRDGWDTVATCSAPTALCDSQAGSCVACAAGDAVCSGLGTLQTCKATRDGWTTETCKYGCYDADGNDDYCGQCSTSDASTCTTAQSLVACTQQKWVTQSCSSCTMVGGVATCVK
jgi:hypothetical protein